MEFHADLYKRAFSKLTASPDQMKEVILMTEKKRPKRFIFRRVVVTAAVLALTFALAAAANAATGGALLGRVIYYASYMRDGQHVGEITVEVNDDNGVGGANTGSYEIVQEGEDGKALFVHIDENGNRTTQSIDLTSAPGAQVPVFRLEDSNGGLKEVEMTGLRLDEAHEAVTLQYKDAQGKEASAVLVLPQDCKGFESIGALLAEKGTVTGQTEDGRRFEIAGKE